jgi:hypothetical protein
MIIKKPNEILQYKYPPLICQLIGIVDSERPNQAILGGGNCISLIFLIFFYSTTYCGVIKPAMVNHGLNQFFTYPAEILIKSHLFAF